MLRFSANISMLFTEVPMLERFQLARDNGFEAVEIQFPYEINLDDLIYAKRQAKVEVVLINLPAADLMTGGEGLACVPGREREFSAAVSLADEYSQALDVPVVNVLAGRCFGSGDPTVLAEYRRVLHQNLYYAANYFESKSIRVLSEAINNHDMPDFLINTDQDMLSLVERVGHRNLAMQVDIYHMATMGCDLKNLFTQHMSKIGHIQFADAPGRHEPGTGTLAFDELFSSIKASTYQGWVGAEYRPLAPTSDHLKWLL